MNWISVRDKSRKPEIGQIVVAWMSIAKEPVCVRYDEDEYGPIWTQLVPVDSFLQREDLISHWIPLPELPYEDIQYGYNNVAFGDCISKTHKRCIMKNCEKPAIWIPVYQCEGAYCDEHWPYKEK